MRHVGQKAEDAPDRMEIWQDGIFTVRMGRDVGSAVVDAAGESYQRRFCKLKIKYNRERNNIIKDILSQEIFNGKERGDNCIFRTFRAGAHIIICDLADWTKKAQKGGA